MRYENPSRTEEQLQRRRLRFRGLVHARHRLAKVAGSLKGQTNRAKLNKEGKNHIFSGAAWSLQAASPADYLLHNLRHVIHVLPACPACSSSSSSKHPSLGI